MAGTTDANWQQYSRWIYVISRSLKVNIPTDSTEIAALKTFIKVFYDAGANTGTRKDWLKTAFQNKSAAPKTGGYVPGDVDTEPIYNIVKLLEVVARDVKKIPLTDDEKDAADVLFAAFPDAKYGKNSDTDVYGTTI